MEILKFGMFLGHFLSDKHLFGHSTPNSGQEEPSGRPPERGEPLGDVVGPKRLDCLHGYRHDSESWDQIGVNLPGFNWLTNGL